MRKIPTPITWSLDISFHHQFFIVCYLLIFDSTVTYLKYLIVVQDMNKNYIQSEPKTSNAGSDMRMFDYSNVQLKRGEVLRKKGCS